MLGSIFIIIIIISFKCSGPQFWPLGVKCALECFKFYKGAELWKTLSVFEAVIHNQTHSSFCIETWTVTPSGILKTMCKQCHISLDQVVQPIKLAANLENKSKSKTQHNTTTSLFPEVFTFWNRWWGPVACGLCSMLDVMKAWKHHIVAVLVRTDETAACFCFCLLLYFTFSAMSIH